MSRRKTVLHEVNPPPPPPGAPEPDEDEDDGRPIRSEHRARMMDLRELVNRMAAATPSIRRSLPLPHEVIDLLEQIAAAGVRPDRRRLVMRARLVMGEDVDVAALEAHLAGHTPAAALERRLTAWRTRILEGGDPAIQRFVEAWPGADRQGIRALAREARVEAPGGSANRRLYRLLREAVEAGAAQPAGSVDEAPVDPEDY